MGLSLARFGGVNPLDASSMPFNKFKYYYQVLKEEFEARNKRVSHHSDNIG